jgi:hypothetical protein
MIKLIVILYSAWRKVQFSLVCLFHHFSEASQMASARFQAAGAIGDAAIREWALLTKENKRSLIL